MAWKAIRRLKTVEYKHGDVDSAVINLNKTPDDHARTEYAA